jgi:hypothetical protein
MVLQRRDEPAPPLDVQVYRVGLVLPADVRVAAQICERAHGVLGISVVSGDLPESDLLHALPLIEHRRSVAKAVHGDLVEAGFELWPTFDAPHHTLVLPDLSDRTLQRLRAPFTIGPNPLYRGHS